TTGACTFTSGATCATGTTATGSICSPTPCVVTAYCAGGSTACGTGDERISRVTINTLDDSPGTGAGPTGCYRDHTAAGGSATTGNTRLRVRLCYTTGLAPCGNASFGTVEDYTVLVAGAAPAACCATNGSCTVVLPANCASPSLFLSGSAACAANNTCPGATS